MKRRNCLTGLMSVCALSAFPVAARAHHGWSSFDQTRPIYLRGVAREVRWRNPHVELILEVAADLTLPEDMTQRSLPSQMARIDTVALLARTQLPNRRDARWEVELAPLTRMNQWRIPEITDGTNLELIGFTFIEERGNPVLRAEYLFLNEQVFGLRSAPAG